MFKVNQKVWCAIYGAGVVTEIRHEGTTYPVVVVFNRNDDESVVTYTADGKYSVDGNITLFTYPIEITKAVTKPSIEWSHVNEDFQYLVQDSDGLHYLFTEKPTPVVVEWIAKGRYFYAEHFASFTPGTCDWKESLVKRPN